MKTNIIVFSSKEQLKFVEKLQTQFYHKDYAVEVWTNGFFELSKSYISNFTNLKLHYDFAIVMVGDDDYVYRSNEKVCIPRDNILLELGMCIEAFSLKRTIIVKKDTVRLPSDLSGIQPIEYCYESGDNIDAVTGTIAAKASQYIESFTSSNDILSWEELFVNTGQIINKLHKSEGMGGFYFDVLVGINRGGLIIAELIAREFGQNKPIISLFADRRNGTPIFDNQDFIINNEDVINMLKNKDIQNILLVDSFTRTGNSIMEGKKYLMGRLPGKRIRTAIVYVNERLRDTECTQFIDYFACYKKLDGKELSLSNYDYYRY